VDGTPWAADPLSVRGGDVRAWRDRQAAERPLRTSWRLFAGSFVAIGVLMVLRLATDRARPLDWLLVALLVVSGFLAVRHQIAVRELEAGGRSEAEGFARILRGLSRSVSPDAIVSAIIDELGDVTGADHVVVVRQPLVGRGLEATLVSSRAGVPSSTTLLASADLGIPPVGGGARQLGASGANARAVPLDDADVPSDPVTGPGGATEVVSVVARQSATATATAPAMTAAAESPPATATATGAGDAGGAAVTLPPGVIVARISERAGRAYGLTNTIAEPLLSQGRVVGALVLSRRVAGEWPAAARRILAAAASEASAALERAHSLREAETAASTDALTGLPNRRYFDEFCGLLARRRRAEDAVGVLMIDIDRFKALNDRFGHATGDDVLRAVARAIAGAVRGADVPARYGGEEFAVLLRNPSGDVAVEVAQRVRRAVGSLDVSEFGPPGVTVSVGVAVAETEDEPIAQLIERADKALYRAKRRGRNRVAAG
jgi:diguanylate cyclase (GGDEF)-like protein